MSRVNVFRPDGIARNIELDSAEHIPSTGRALPWLGLRPNRYIIDPTDSNRRISVVGYIGSRITEQLKSDPTDPWCNLSVVVGHLYYQRELDILFCEARTGWMPSHTYRYFELTEDEACKWFEAEGIVNPRSEGKKPSSKSSHTPIGQSFVPVAAMVSEESSEPSLLLKLLGTSILEVEQEELDQVMMNDQSSSGFPVPGDFPSRAADSIRLGYEPKVRIILDGRRFPDRWLCDAQGFYYVLKQWLESLTSLQTDEIQLNQESLSHPPIERSYHHQDGSLGSTLDIFRSETANLASEISNEPSVRDVGSQPLFEFLHLIDSAFSEAEAGRPFDIRAIRLALDRATPICGFVTLTLLKRSPRQPQETPPVESEKISLADSLRKKRPRASIQIAFLEFMETRDRAEFSELAEHVHGDAETEDNAIRANIYKINRYFEEVSIPMRFRSGSGFVYKESNSE